MKDKTPIANPESYNFKGDATRLFQFQFGPYTGTELYVWDEACGFGEALEIAAEWLVEHAPGFIEALDSDEHRERCDETRADLTRKLGRAPTDEELWTALDVDHTLTESGYIFSDDWRGYEVMDADEYETVRRRSIDHGYREDARDVVDETATVEPSATVERREDGSIWVAAWVRVADPAPYVLTLDKSEIRTCEFVGGRYGWPSILDYLEDGDRTIRLSKDDAYEWALNASGDAEGGHNLFPMLAPGSDLYRKLSDLYRKIQSAD